MSRCSLSVALFLLFPFLTPAAEPPRSYADGRFGKAELKYLDGLPVLTVAGTPEEMGTQIAALTEQPLRQLLGYPKVFLKSRGVEAAWPGLVLASRLLEPQFPPAYLRELNALVTRAHLDRDEAVVGNTLPDIRRVGGCSTLVVEAARSSTGGPLFGRNLDYDALGLLDRYVLVTVYRPQGKIAFASIGYPGLIGCISGINARGLALATNEVYAAKDGSPRFNARGMPYTMGYRRILEECATVEEAERLLRSLPRTTLNNLTICDKTHGAVFEITPRSVVVRRPLAGLCVCTNHFRTPELATSLQCLRFATLERSRLLDHLGLADVSRQLDAVNQGEHTIQTMIFEPAALRLHLAFGSRPSSKLPLRPLDLGPLFSK